MPLPYTVSATFTNGSAVVNAPLAAFNGNVYIGDPVRGPDDLVYYITAKNSNTQVVIDRNYVGTTATASVPFFRRDDKWASFAEINTKHSELIESFGKGFATTSASSLAISAGVKTATIGEGWPLLAGGRLRFSSRSSVLTRYFDLDVTAYAAGVVTGTVAADGFLGSGTYTDWNVNYIGAKGAVGATGISNVTIQIFTASGTWTKPVGCRAVRVTVVGGGGGGGGSNTTVNRGGKGGGSGGMSIKWIDVTAIATVAVTVGAAGAAGAIDGNGGAGGASSFGAHCSAGGGAGGGSGLFQSNAYGGLGGSATGGDINVIGQTGSGGGIVVAVIAIGGMGGSNAYGGGGAMSFGNSADSATGYGSGGGGAGTSDATPTAGGTAGPGIVIVEEIY